MSLDQSKKKKKLQFFKKEKQNGRNRLILPELLLKESQAQILNGLFWFQLTFFLKEIISIINESRYSEIFNKWRTAKEVVVSKTEPNDVFYIRLSSKIRYINPLVDGKRIYDIDEESRKVIFFSSEFASLRENCKLVSFLYLYEEKLCN